MAPEISRVIKRTGAVVPFNPDRITNAIYRAAVAVGGRDRATAEALTGQVVAILEETIPPDQYPTVEQIQDVVEKVLIENGHAKVAKAYILYREERARSPLAQDLWGAALVGGPRSVHGRATEHPHPKGRILPHRARVGPGLRGRH